MDARKVCCYQHFSVIVVDVLQLLQVERNCMELSENMLTLIVTLDTAVHNLAKQPESFTVPRATFSKQNQGHVTNNSLQNVAVISVYKKSRQVIMSSRCVRNAMTYKEMSWLAVKNDRSKQIARCCGVAVPVAAEAATGYRSFSCYCCFCFYRGCCCCGYLWNEKHHESKKP